MEKSSNILSVLIVIIINALFLNLVNPIDINLLFTLTGDLESLTQFWQIVVLSLNSLLVIFVIIGCTIIGFIIECLLFTIFKSRFNIIFNTYILENYKFELKNEE